MSEQDRDDGYADFGARGKPGRPKKIGWEHPATEGAIARARSNVEAARDHLEPDALAEGPSSKPARIGGSVGRLEDAKGCLEAAVRELMLAIAGERITRGLNR